MAKVKADKLQVKEEYRGKHTYGASFGNNVLDENTPQEFLRKMIELSEDNWKYIEKVGGEQTAEEQADEPQN